MTGSLKSVIYWCCYMTPICSFFKDFDFPRYEIFIVVFCLLVFFTFSVFVLLLILLVKVCFSLFYFNIFSKYVEHHWLCASNFNLDFIRRLSSRHLSYHFNMAFCSPSTHVNIDWLIDWLASLSATTTFNNKHWLM